jgi:CRP/FNR family cyclic AMP-dependent transcriptional regulator
MFARSIRSDRKHHPLGAVSLFQGCTGAELDTIVSITTPIHPPAGRLLCREGERGDEFFVIVDGEAAVTIAGERVATLGPGDFFGEMALLDGGPHIATVTATTSARMLVLTRPEFNALLERVPVVCHRVLMGVGHRLRQPAAASSVLVAA